MQKAFPFIITIQLLLLPIIGIANEAQLEKEVQHLRQRVSQLRIDMQRNDLNLKKAIQALQEKIESIPNKPQKALTEHQKLQKILKQKDLRIQALEAELEKLKNKQGNVQVADEEKPIQQKPSQTQAIEEVKITSTETISQEQPLSQTSTNTQQSLNESNSVVKISETDLQLMYDQGISYLSKSEYSNAQRIFSKLIKENPQNVRVPNAIYWLAETFYYQEDYNNAYTEYNYVVENFPTSEKAGQALLKSGLTKMEMEEYKDARRIFSLVIQQYPQSRLSQEASHKLNLIGILNKEE